MHVWICSCSILSNPILSDAAGDAIPMSDYTTIVARVAQMMAILLYLNHVIVPWLPCVCVCEMAQGFVLQIWIRECMG